LQEGKRVRVAYLDEAGIGNPTHEPYTVVAGIIIHPDSQWTPIAGHLHDLADRFAPLGRRDGFVFHATELFSGGEWFPKLGEEGEKEKRWAILDHLVRVPAALDVPVVYGAVNRALLAEVFRSMPARRLAVNAQTIAFARCAHVVDFWIRCHTDDEVVSIVLEQNDQARTAIKEMTEVVRNPQWLDSPAKFDGSRIVDTAHFAKKSESSPLQIADACAFAIKRHLMQKPDSDRFYEPLMQYIVQIS
jgi:Protein of unknown function (DUF3800)